MTLTTVFIVYLYIVGGAGFGAAMINNDRSSRVGVIDMLILLVWPITMFVLLAAELIKEFRN